MLIFLKYLHINASLEQTDFNEIQHKNENHIFLFHTDNGINARSNLGKGVASGHIVFCHLDSVKVKLKIL